MKIKTKNRHSFILNSIFRSLWGLLAILIKWGIGAVEKNQLKKPTPAPPEKNQLKKPTPAPPEKKKRRKMVQVSRRANRT